MAKWSDSYHNGVVDAATAIKWYNSHNAEIRRSVPSERLLDFKVSDGWERLCNFLGVPVPGVPFPHVNDMSAFANALMVLWAIVFVFRMPLVLTALFVFRLFCETMFKAKIS